MTTENYLAFKEFENKLASAKNSGFARFSAPELERFSQILSKHRGTPLSRQERTCPHCLLVTLKKVAEEFYKFQDSPRGKTIIKGLENAKEENGNNNEVENGETEAGDKEQ